MNISDMDMLQDYEKDARMAALAYAIVETDIMDKQLRALVHKGYEAASKAQQAAASLIMARGDRP
ncbi:MAG TPA: hypothetical protein GXX28_08120 [Firmicutes bacterium]|nr:hypothetical protein [Bacillota bacterium]